MDDFKDESGDAFGEDEGDGIDEYGGDITGFYDDDGTKINPNLIVKPPLCISCVHDDDPEQEIRCVLNRFGQQGEGDFICGSYRRRKKG